MDTAFDSDATRFLAALTSAFEDALPQAEVDLEGGVLTVELDDGGTYVINKHAPTQQIWVSSPASGATHFARDQGSGRWIDTRGGRDLAGMLREEIRAATGVELALG
jgi:frataxin